MEKRLLILLLLMLITSCSGDSNTTNEESNTSLIENTQWVFDHYEFINETATPEDIQSIFFGEIGVDFTIDEVVNKTNLIWNDFVITFDTNNTGSIQDVWQMSSDNIFPMEWDIVEDNRMRIIYEANHDNDESSGSDTRIIYLENININNNSFSFEFEFATKMGFEFNAKHYGRYIFD